MDERKGGPARGATFANPVLVLMTILAFTSPGLRGAGPPGVTLSLDEARERALASNPDFLLERGNFLVAETSVRRAGGAYDPTLRLDARWRDRTDPLNTILSGAPPGELGPSTKGPLGAASLSQLLLTGGRLSLTTSVSREETNNTFSLLSPSWTTGLGAELRQPLLQGRSIDPARRTLWVARIDRERSLSSLRRSAEETVASAEKAWWTLLATGREVEARQSAVALAERQRDDVAVRISAGTLSEADAAAPEAEVERRRGDLFGAREAVAQAENALKAILLDDPADPLWSARLVPAGVGEKEAEGPDAADPEAAAQRADGARTEVEEARKLIARVEIEEEQARNRVLPQLDLVASYLARGLAGSQNPGAPPPLLPVPVVVPSQLEGGLGTSSGHLFENRFPDASIGLSLTVPLGNRSARADAAIARIQREQAAVGLARTRQRVEVEARNAAAALTSARQRTDAARAGRRAAEVLLGAEQDRFDAGLTTSYFVLTRQNDLTQARIAESSAAADLARARVELLRATGGLLKARGVELSEIAGKASPPGGPK